MQMVEVEVAVQEEVKEQDWVEVKVEPLQILVEVAEVVVVVVV